MKKDLLTDANTLVIFANEGNICVYGACSRFGIVHDVFGLKQVDKKMKYLSRKEGSFEYVLAL